MNLRRRLLEACLVLIGGAVLLVFLPIAFGLMPTGFFSQMCAVGEIFGTSMLCYAFMWNTITTGVLIGVTGPALGIFLVHREMALIGETLAHTAFAGVALGTLFVAATGWDARLLLSALVVAIIGAIGLQLLTEHTSAHGDVPLAIILTGSFALGTLFIDLGGGFAFVDINSYLFGDISITDDRSVFLMAVMSLIVVGTVVAGYKPLLFITFDEEVARAANFPVPLFNGVLIVLTAMVVVGAMQILGVILVAAMLVVPVAAASQALASFRDALYASIVIGVTAVLAGIGGSWHFGFRPGATIVVVAIAFYLSAVVATSR